MAAENDFLPFAIGNDANVIDQATYAAAAFLAEGFQAGIANSAQLNKVWRQSAFVAAGLAQFMANQTGDAVLDNGDLDAFVTLLSNAIVIGAGVKPMRKITASANVGINLADYRIAVQRTVAVAPFTLTLPAGAAIGQSFKVGDTIGNFNANPVTIAPQAGQNIANAANYVMNQDKMWAEFALVDANTWSLEL